MDDTASLDRKQPRRVAGEGLRVRRRTAPDGPPALFGSDRPPFPSDWYPVHGIQAMIEALRSEQAELR